MKLIETIQVGCNVDSVATINDPRIIFNHYTAGSHNPIVNLISGVLWEAQYLQEKELLTGPAKICVLFSSYNICNWIRVKESNQSTFYDTVKWFLMNMHPPKYGVVFSIYEYPSDMNEWDSKYSANCLWSFNQHYRWRGDGDYITVHKAENNKSNGLDTLSRTLVSDIEKYTDVDVKYIDYTMSEDQIFSTIKDSRLHITYHGGTYWSAPLSGVPMLCYGFPRGSVGGKLHIKFGGQRAHIDGSSWNNHIGNVCTKLHQYDWTNQRVYQYPQNFVKHVDHNQLLSYLNNEPIEYYERTHQIIDQN